MVNSKTWLAVNANEVSPPHVLPFFAWFVLTGGPPKLAAADAKPRGCKDMSWQAALQRCHRPSLFNRMHIRRSRQVKLLPRPT
jgi:hypothetical protein